MREAKFRYVWKHEETGRIRYELFTLTEIERGVTTHFIRWHLTAKNQWTGECDKRGKGIYEGDIVSRDGFNFIVELNDGCFQAVRLPYLSEPADRYPLYLHDYKIIGNIYKDNELLDAGDENDG